MRLAPFAPRSRQKSTMARQPVWTAPRLALRSTTTPRISLLRPSPIPRACCALLSRRPATAIAPRARDPLASYQQAGRKHRGLSQHPLRLAWCAAARRPPRTSPMPFAPRRTGRPAARRQCCPIPRRRHCDLRRDLCCT